MTGAPLLPADAVQILLGWQRNARSALRWLHRDWLAFAFCVERNALGDGALDVMRAGCDEACSLAILRVLMSGPPSLEALSTLPASRLDALPVETGLNVLRMLALIARRSEVRRLVDRTTRKQLALWIGCPLDDLLGRVAPETPSLACMKRERSDLRTLGSLNSEDLAFEGLDLLTLAGVRNTLLRLALPQRGTDLASRASPSAAECEVAFKLLRERMRLLLPEYAWLSG